MFSDNCYACHGPNEDSREGGFRLGGPQSLRAVDVTVPGDLSSAAFLVEVTAGCFGIYAKLRRNAKIYRHNQYDPVPDPQCSSEEAWKVAVQSGVPAGALVDMIYRDDDYMRQGSPAVWSITIDGEPQHQREVHGRTCQLYRSFASGSPVLMQ